MAKLAGLFDWPPGEFVMVKLLKFKLAPLLAVLVIVAVMGGLVTPIPLLFKPKVIGESPTVGAGAPPKVFKKASKFDWSVAASALKF